VNISNLSVLKNYLQKRSVFQSLIKTKIDVKPGLIVVIPCYNEPDIIKTLNSLENCEGTKKKIEVIIVINSSEITNNEVIDQNKKTKNEIKEWVCEVSTNHHTYHTILIENTPKKIAGAGYARKVGMDEAVRRFLLAEVENGIICSLDADSLVSPNYFIEIEKLFNENESCNGCSIYFEHATKGNEFTEEVYRRITEYELHIRYYKLALKHIGFPYYHYTVGSSFAVSANAYCKQGGMNKKQAGEDFYFLQKIMPIGNYYELNTTTVYPSSRPSDRVPFGTGPIINQYLEKPKKEFLTYNFEAFDPLKQLFADKNLFFKANSNKLENILSNHHPSMKAFLKKNHYKSAIETINKNTVQLKNFEKRFFNWFDGFKVIKYLNFAHENYYHKQPINKAVRNHFRETQNIDYKNLNTKEKLIIVRNLEKKSRNL